MVVAVSQAFLDFDDLDRLRILVRYSVVGVHLMRVVIRPGLWGFERTITEVKVLFTSVKCILS